MARAIWSGTVSFGLVSIPVRLYTATSPQDISFNQFERDSGERIHYKRVAGDTDREVDWDDIVKGYEVSKGEYVIVEPEELEAVDPGQTRTIEIEDFVELAEIDPVYFEKTYYLGPASERGAEKPYALLLKALERSGRVGIGRFVLRSKEYLAAVRPSDGLLAVETMFFADEVRDDSDVAGVPVKAKASGRELDMAEQLIEAQTTSWDPKKYRDVYRERVLELIEKKAAGEEIVTERAPKPKATEDIMDALRRSVEAVKRGERPAAEGDGEAEAGTRGNGGRRRRSARSKESFEQWPRQRLYERAKDLDIPGRSDMTKDELVEALRKAS